MKKICFVVQRYGLEVNGGAELHCRLFAEKMTALYDVTVITTKAIDYVTWRNEYTEDEETLNGIRVKRFKVEKERDHDEFEAILARFLENKLKRSEEQEFLEKQGPYTPALVQYIRDHKSEYDVFILYGYLYYQTVMAISEVADKAIVLPLAHDEPFLRMRIYDQIFRKPRFFFFNTEEERDLVREKYNNYNIPYLIGGIGLDIPADVNAERFKKKYGLNNYIVYVGRIDEGKNCHVMFDYFLRYKKSHKDDLKLVLMGKPAMDIPKHKDIVLLGFVDEQDKFDGVSGAKFLLLPSKYESLSMVVLEAFCLNVPVLVDKECPVLKAHIDKSRGGYYYSNYYGFESKTLQLLLHDDLRHEMGARGHKYVDENYSWSIIVRKLSYLIEKI